jgi:HKD family nuclease
MAHLVRVVSQPWSQSRTGDEVLEAFGGPYTQLFARIGFVNASGVRHVARALGRWRKAGKRSCFVVGVDGSVTSEAGVRALLRLADELWLFRNPGRALFHPKTFLFASDTQARALIGSANLTESALWINYEDTAVVDFDLSDPRDRQQVESLEQDLRAITATPNAHRADETLIDSLVAEGLLPSEAERRRTRNQREITNADPGVGARGRVLFPPFATGVPPAVEPLAEERADAKRHKPPGKTTRGSALPSLPPRGAQHSAFVMRLGHRDAGTRAGFSPDVFIPLAALDADKAFWGRMRPMTTPRSSYDERYIVVEFRRRSGQVEHDTRRLYRYHNRSELRFNARQVHEDSRTGDLMVIELAPPGVGVEYVVRVVRPSDPLYGRYDAIAATPVMNSEKRWGFV